MNDEIVSIVEERAPIETTITVDYIEVEAPKPAEIELDEAFPPIGEANEQLNHTLLHNRDSADQHPIVAITGLREELDEIESLKSVYADKVNVANYYKWNTGAYDTAGYFVSLVPHSTTIKICDGADIFGVTVDSAGFIGGQNEEIPRDNSYALVATSGLVDVRCESTVAEGDYVISNAQGMAEKTTSSCGYKVIAVNDDRTHDPGVLYATIALGVQACTTDAISKSVQHIEDRVDNNEINIAAAMNVANQAYNKAQESVTAGQIMGDQVSDALGKVEDMSSEFENIMTQVGNSALISAQAKAIAESAATSAESMKNEAVEKANEALAENSNLRREFEVKVEEIDRELENTTLELQSTKEVFDATINDLKLDTEGQLADFKKEVSENYATTTQLAAVKTETSDAIAAVKQEASDTYATIETVTALQTETSEAMAGFRQEVTDKYATQEMLTAYKNDTSEALSLYKTEVAENYATQEMVSVLETDTTKALTDYKQEVSDTYATQEMVTKLETDTSKALTDYKQEVGDTYATQASLTTLRTDTTNAITASEEKATNTYASKSDLTSFESETNIAMARIEQKADANGAYIQSTVSNMDKYSVGPYSQAYGFTLEQAKDVLEKGMVYVPTVSHGGESFNTDYAFTKTNTYTWSGETWIEDVGKVVFSSTAPSGSAYSLWYTDNDTVTSGYEPYTLYKYGTYETVDDNGNSTTESHWEPVATLKGNSSNRAVSQIRQDANSITAEVTNARGSAATLGLRITNTESEIQSLASWTKDPNGNQYNLAAIKQTADGAGASIAQVVEAVGENGEVDAASIALAINKEGSLAVINADHIKFEGFVSFANKDDVDEVKDNAVYDTKVEYALSSSFSEFIAVTGADGQWSTTAPVWRIDAYMWQKTTITKGDTSVASTQTCIQGAKGNDGTGIAIKGTAYIKDVVVSDAIIGNEYIIYKDAQCTTQITNAEDGDSYLIDGYLFVYSGAGSKFTCTGKIQGPAGETPTVSVSSDGYWVVNGTKLDTKAEGETPTVEINADGYWVINEEVTGVKAEGDAGVGVSNIINYYMASSRAAGVVAGTSGETTDEQWTTDVQTVSEGKPYLWNYETTFYTNGGSKSTDATIIGNYSKDGVNGRGIQSIEEFYCISASDTCATPNTYTLNKAVNYSGTAVAGTWYKTSPPTDLTNKYLWNCERITYTEGQPEIFAPALIGTHGTKGADGVTPTVGANGNWWLGDADTGVKAEGTDGSTPTVEISNDGYWVINGSKTTVKAIGVDAPTVVSEKKQFYLSTSNTSCVGGSWADSPSGFQYSGNKYMWSRSVYTMSDDSIIEGNPALDKTYTTISNWCMENDETIINGAHIATGTIDAEKINTNAIRSHNYPVDRDGNPIIPSGDDYFSSSGTFLDLSNGAFYSPNFAITNSGNVHFQGNVVAQGGEIAGWDIGEQGLTKADANIEIGLSPGNGGTYNDDQDNLGLVLYAGIKAPKEPKAIAGTWRFTEASDDIKDFLRDAYLDDSVEFAFYGWFNHPTSGWTKYEGQNARLTFVYSGDEAFEITLSVDGSNAEMVWGCGSYNGTPWTSDQIGNYLLNREIGFGVEGIDDVWIGDYRFGTNILNSIATFIPGSIGLYPTMLDKDGRLYAQEVRLGGSTDSVIEVGRCAVGNLIINDDAIVYKKGWNQAGGLYLGKDGLTVGENFIVQSQGVATKSVIVGGAANTHTDGTVACKVLRATQEIIGTVSTSSDRNKKNSIEELDERYDEFFDALEPQRFKYNNGTSDRYHIGYITQDVQDGLVQANLMEQEFAGIITIDVGTDTEESYLRYNEFVALNTLQIQKLKKRVDTLEAKNAELEERLTKLEALLNNNAE